LEPFFRHKLALIGARGCQETYSNEVVSVELFVRAMNRESKSVSRPIERFPPSKTYEWAPITIVRRI
jgi:hypothetical protein